MQLSLATTGSRPGFSARRALRGLTGALVPALLLSVTPLAATGAESGLPAEIVALLGAEPLPAVAVDPTKRFALLVHERRLVALDRLAEPAVEIAGRLVNPLTATRHAPLDYYGLTVVDFETAARRTVELPEGATIGFPSWAPDGSRFAFTVTGEDDTSLWIGDPETAEATPRVDRLNAMLGTPCGWAPDSRHVLCKRLDAHDALRRRAAENVLGAAAGLGAAARFGGPRTMDEPLAAVLLESQLVSYDTLTNARRPIAEPAAIESFEPAPSGGLLLVTRLRQPYPRIGSIDERRSRTEVWNLSGRVVAELPDDARAAGWHASRPATLAWVATGDERDRVVLSAPPYDAPIERFELPHAFAGLRWIEHADAALVSDYDPAAKRTEIWHVDFGTRPAAAVRIAGFASAAPKLPVTDTTPRGSETVRVHEGGVFLESLEGAGAERRVTLEHVALDTGKSRRIWQAQVAGHETLVDVLTPDASWLLTRRASRASPPSYVVTNASGDRIGAVTHAEHPAAALNGTERVRLSYTRADGESLSATLYLPPGYDGESRLPAVLWAYPRNVRAGGVTSMPSSPDRFMSFERAFRLYFLLAGYAVLDDVSMPVVGTAETANDTFIDQIVANARSAIGAAAATGHVDPERVGVAGHSYGAFMVANLLAHSDLFGAGAALSGAYNRTLTPFGFQTERRTLWEATDTYLSMSPILYSHRIGAPLLLVHGTLDDNAGTAPFQSTQFFEAIRGNGGNASLLLLPYEGHSYRARESVLTTAAEMLNWFDEHLTGGTVHTYAAGETVEAGARGAFLRPQR